jgi:hypothetical protein
MMVWAFATVAFVLVATLVPPVRDVLKTSPLQAGDWALAACAALIGAFWVEVRKMLQLRPT